MPESVLKQIGTAADSVYAERHAVLEGKLNNLLGRAYYSSTGFILYNLDSLDVLEQLNGAGNVAVDLTITSPPYNIGKEYEQKLRVEDYIEWCSRWMKLVHGVTSANGSLWLNLGYFEVPEKGLCVPIPYLLWDKSPFYLLQEIVWQYGAGVSCTTRLSPRNEKWMFYVKDPEKYTFHLDDIRDSNVKYPNQKKNNKYRCNPLGKNPSDVWSFPKVTTGNNRSSKERTAHPAQFPVPVVDRIVKACSSPSDLVFDPFAGSATTGIVARANSRLFVGVELDERYCEVAAKRYEAVLKEHAEMSRQTRLF